MPLSNDDQLERSSVVANCCMNRERELRGSNGYARDLRFDPLERLRTTVLERGAANWLDLCCGSGIALREAALIAASEGWGGRLSIVGVDLVDPGGSNRPADGDSVRFVESSIARWTPTERFDLITCVHGLHYVGDKIGVVCRFAACLRDGGLFAANFDVRDIRLNEALPTARVLRRHLCDAGLTYDSRRKLLRSEGGTPAGFRLRYLGADDSQGPNYTGQAAVVSYYAS